MPDNTWPTPIRSAKGATIETTDGTSVPASIMNAPKACPVVVSTSTRIKTCVVITSSVAAVSDQKVKDAMRRNM